MGNVPNAEDSIVTTAKPDPVPELAARRQLWPHGVSLAIVALTVLILHLMDRVWWCQCGKMFPWTSDIWSEHCSQHLLDPYVFSHISHGFFFYGLVVWLPFKYKRPSFAWVMVIAVLIECAWEILENSPIIINRYRATTIAIGYTGDSVINSIIDIIACITGVLIARACGFWKTLAIFLAFEIGTLIWVRDNLSLNVLMLVWPIEAIKHWQSAISG
ncbi:MAG: DUF2585 family protein [Phycisphaerales bacterium]|nr:DUF2585 family protein [Phycisphaerales bacterium]